jgi:hypothetical protein
MAPFEIYMRERIRVAEQDAIRFGPGLARVRANDAEALRGILRTWENSLTPSGQAAAELGLPTGPFDGGIA